MQPEDISRVAFELKPIMMPEMQSAVKDELINFQAMLAEAVRNINHTIKSEVAEIKAEMSLLKKQKCRYSGARILLFEKKMMN